MKSILLTTLAFAAIATAQSPFINLESIDAHAANATQVNLQVQFGPGTKPGSFQCPLQKSSPTGYCLATAYFNVPAGKRFVVENISVAFRLNSNGSGVVFAPAMNLGVNVGNTTAFSVFPFDTSVSTNGIAYYMMNKNVRFYIDPGAGFPEILFSTLTNDYVLPGDFGAATGNFSITFQGYLIPLP